MTNLPYNEKDRGIPLVSQFSPPILSNKPYYSHHENVLAVQKYQYSGKYFSSICLSKKCVYHPQAILRS